MNKIIYRMCIHTRKKCDRSLLFRVVRIDKNTVVIDTNGTIKGRGTYICKDKKVILDAKKRNSLSKGLRMPVNESIYDELIALL